MRWVWRGGAAAVIVLGWLFILVFNNFHLTPPVVFVALGYLAAVATIYNLFHTGVAVVTDEDEDNADTTWGRPIGATADLEREKKTLLKAIKEAEFDLQMGKLSQKDADEMIRVYRLRAIEVIKELDAITDRGNTKSASVRDQIDREVRARLEIEGKGRKKGQADAKQKKNKKQQQLQQQQAKKDDQQKKEESKAAESKKSDESEKPGTKAESKDSKAGSDEPATKAESKDTKAGSEEPATKAESKDTKAGSKDTKAESKDTKAESKDTKAESKDTKAEAKDTPESETETKASEAKDEAKKTDDTKSDEKNGEAKKVDAKKDDDAKKATGLKEAAT